MFGSYFAATVFSFIALTYIKVEVSANIEKELWRHLFEGKEYDTLFRPVKDPKTAVHVTVGIAPISMEIMPSTIFLHKYFHKFESWLVVEWKDEYLTWNPKDFGNIEQLFLPISKVWSPNLFLYPSKTKYDPESSFVTNMTSNVAIRFDGELTWMSPNTVVHYYELKAVGNRQYITCEMSIMSWTYDASQMNIDVNKNMTEKLDAVTIQTSKELKYFSWSEQPYPIIHFTFMKLMH